MNDFCLAECFEVHRVPDDVLAEGYERTSSEHRAWLKTTLALAQSVYGESPTSCARQTVNTQTGFGHAVQSGPAPWALVAVSAQFCSAPRLAAALMVARLANLDNLVVVRVADPATPHLNGTDAFPPALIAALELTGIDHVLSLTLDETTELCSTLHHTYGSGRLLLFGAGHTSLLRAAFDSLSQAEGLPLWFDRAPRLGISHCAVADESLLRWAHSDGTLTTLHSLSEPVPGVTPTVQNALKTQEDALLAPAGLPLPCFDALLCAAPDEALPATAPLRLVCNGVTSLAGAWLPLSLTPTFFHDSVLTAFMVQNDY